VVTLSVTAPGVLVCGPVIDLGQTGAVAAVRVQTGSLALCATTWGRQLDTVLVNKIAP
jgi:hypothetical protein